MHNGRVQMDGNPEIKQIPWKNDPELVRAWEEARTGYPWIDAIMTQLRQWCGAAPLATAAPGLPSSTGAARERAHAGAGAGCTTSRGTRWRAS